MSTLAIYVGANNRTGKVERDKLIQTLAKYHRGFTITPAIGYWDGSQEQSVVVTIADDKSAILSTIKRLKQVLHQDAIAYQEVNEMEFV